MKKQKQYMTPDEARRLFRKRKPSGQDVGRLWVYIQVQNLLSVTFERQEADSEILSPQFLNKLAMFKTHLFSADRQSGITNQDGDLGLEIDHEQMYENMKICLMTAFQEYWQVMTLCSEAISILKNLYAGIFYSDNSELFEISQSDIEKVFDNFSENLESHVYYVNATNHSFDLLSERYLIDLTGLKLCTEDLRNAVNTLIRKFNVLISAIEDKEHPFTETISQISEQCKNLDYEKMIEIPANREEEAQRILKKRLPYFGGDNLNTVICLWEKKEE